MTQVQTFTFWTPNNQRSLASKVVFLVIDILAVTMSASSATSNLKFLFLPIGLAFAAILIYELREGFKLKSKAIEVDNNSIRYYERWQRTKTDQDLSNIVALTQMTSWTQGTEFQIKFRDGETITFDAKADPDGDLCRLVESKTNLTFQEQK